MIGCGSLEFYAKFGVGGISYGKRPIIHAHGD